MGRTGHFDFSPVVDHTRIEDRLLGLALFLDLEFLGFGEGVVDVQEELSPSSHWVVFIVLADGFGLLVVGCPSPVHVQETLDVVILQLMLLPLGGRHFAEEPHCVRDPVLQDEVVDEGQLHSLVLRLLVEDSCQDELSVVFSELLDSDGGLALIGKFVDPAGVVGVVFEDGEVEGVEGQPFCESLLEVLENGFKVLVAEGKAPDFGLIEVPFPEDLQALVVELLVLEFPHDGPEVKLVAVKDVLARQKLIDFLVGARLQDVIQGLLLVHSLSASHHHWLYLAALRHDHPVSAGVGWVHSVLALLWEVKLSLKCQGAVGADGNVADLGLLMVSQRNSSLGNIDEQLNLEGGPRNVGEDGLQSIGLEGEETVNGLLDLSAILLVRVLFFGIEEALVQHNAL